MKVLTNCVRQRVDVGHCLATEGVTAIWRIGQFIATAKMVGAETLLHLEMPSPTKIFTISSRPAQVLDINEIKNHRVI